MPKAVIPFTAKLVVFDTIVPFAEVISRLDIMVNKAGSNNIAARLRLVKNQQEFITLVGETAENDFLYFMEYPHHNLLRIADGKDKSRIIVYTIGNPLIAQAILRYNPLASYSIPPRLLVTEIPNGKGTTVSYHLPSTIMGMPIGDNDPTLRVELEALDEKIERLVKNITAI